MKKRNRFSHTNGMLLGVLFCIFFLSSPVSSRIPSVIKIGAIFEDNSIKELNAFNFALEQINRHRTILPNTKLEVFSEFANDIFVASKKVCRVLKQSYITDERNSSGIAGLFTLTTPSTTDLMDAICEAFTLPLIQPQPDLSNIRQTESRELLLKMKVSIHPDLDALSDAYRDFIVSFGWKQLVILYTNPGGLMRMKSILNDGFIRAGSQDQKLDIIFWQMDDMEKTLKELRHNVQYKRILVDIEPENIASFLDIASRMGILTSYHHYMFSTLDLEAINVGLYTLGGVNITGYRLVDTKNSKSQGLLRDWVLNSVRPQSEASSMLKSRNALIIDSVHYYAQALSNYLQGLDDFSTTSFNCQQKNRERDNMEWPPGESIYNELISTEYAGLTGRVRLNENGRRTDFELDLIEYDTDGKLQLIGHWSRSEGLNVTKSSERRQEDIQKDLLNKTLRVVVKEEDPLIMVRKFDAEGRPIPDGSQLQFYGYLVDMMEEIAANLNLTYNMYLSPDGATGVERPNGSYTGMIGELLNGNADLAMSDLTITYERATVIDFTKPFMNLGISILFKKPLPDPPKLFSFLEPLDNNIWICMLGSYAFVSVFLFIVARFSPYEWKNPHPCNPESDLVENEFTLLNAFWFTIGSLMQQGCEIAPKASSTRIIAGVWWFFTLILISSYTANLAAFLTITRMTTPIKNADDLSRQTDIKYGSKYGGATYRFFRDSNIPTYERMWNFMSQHEDLFVNNSDLGIAKVKAGKYAYLMESIPLRYQLSKHCDLMEVGGEMNSVGYGIGLPKDSPYRDALSNALLSLSEQQILLNLYNRWWNVENSKCKETTESQSPTTASKLGMRNLGGVFVFLIGGLSFSLIIALIEFLINAFVNSKADRQTLCSEIAEECRFAVKCWGPSEKLIKQPHMNGAVVTGDENEQSKSLTADRETTFIFT